MTAQLDAPVLDFASSRSSPARSPRPGRGVQRDPRLPRRPTRAVAVARRSSRRATARSPSPARRAHRPRPALRPGVAVGPGGERLPHLRRDQRRFSLSLEAAAVLAEEESPASLIAGLRAHRRGMDGGRQARPRVHHRRRHPLARARPARCSARWRGSTGRLPHLAPGRVAPAVPGLIERLESGIRVLDVGCGLGVPTILMAEAFPNSTFVGVDYHEESIRLATAAAEEAGVADRVQFKVATRRRTTASTTSSVLRRRARHGRPGRRPRPRPQRAPAGRCGARDRAVRRRHPRGQPRQPDRPGVLRGQLGPLRPAQHLPRAVPHWARRQDRPSSPRPSAGRVLERRWRPLRRTTW